eukprot:g7770.t2
MFAAEGLLGLGLSGACFNWRKAATPLEICSQYRTGRPVSTGIGPTGGVGLDHVFYPSDNVQEMDRADWRSPVGEAFGRQPAQTGEAQQSPPPLQPPPWQTLDVVPHTRAVADTTDTADTADTAAVLLDRGASRIRAKTASWSSASLDREAAAAGYQDGWGWGWGWAGASDWVMHNEYRGHQRIFSDGHHRATAGLPPPILTPLQSEGGHHQRWPSSSPLAEHRRTSWVATHARFLGVRDSHRQSYTTHPITNKAAALKNKPRSAPFGDVGSGGRSDGEGGLSKEGGGLASSSQGSKSWWSAAGSRSHGAGAHTNSDHDRELCHNDRLQHDVGPPRVLHHHRRHSRGHDRHWRQSSTSPLAGTTTITTRPVPARRGGDDSVECSIALRPLRPAASRSVRPPSRLPGLAEVVVIAGDEAAEKVSRFSTVRDVQDHPDGGGHCGAGEGVGGGSGAVEWGHRKQKQRRPFHQVPTKSTTIGDSCMEDGCSRRARFSFKGTRKPVYCEKHKLVGGMVDTRHRQCKSEQCSRQPSFGMVGDKRPSYCVSHKTAEMINVIARRCKQTGCYRHPTFGFLGDKRPSFCKQHRETGMVDVASRRCRYPFCLRRPLYNMDGLRPVWCSRHKLPGMIDVVSARCQEPGCLRHPSFGDASERKARRCARHRLENMESAEAGRREGPLDNGHGDERRFATEGLLGLGFRTAEISSHCRRGRPLSGSAGTIGGVELEQGYCPPGTMQEMDQSGWRSPEGEAFRRRPGQDVEAQPPPRQTVDLVRHARAVAGNACTAHNACAAAVLSEQGASKTRAMTPSQSLSTVDRGAAAAVYVNSRGRGWAGTSGLEHHGYRDHRRAFSDGHHRDAAGSPPSILAPLRREGGQHGRWLSWSHPTEQTRLSSAPFHGMRDSYRQSFTASPVTTETSAPVTWPRPPPHGDVRSDEPRGGGRVPSLGGAGLVHSGLGEKSRWSVAGNRSRGAGAHTNSDHDRDLCHDDRLSREDAPPRAQQYHHSPDHHHQGWQSSQPPQPGAITTTATSPGSEGRGGRGSAQCSIALRPLMCPVVSGSVRPTSPLPGLAKVFATAKGDEAGEGFRRFSTVGDFHGHPGGGGHGGDGDREGAGGGVGFMDWAHRKPRQRRLVSGMVDTRHRFCKREECTRQPSFGMEAEARLSDGLPDGALGDEREFATGGLPGLGLSTGTLGGVKLEQEGYYPPGTVQELDPRGWGSPAGEAFRRRPAQAREAQAALPQSPPQLQREPPQTMDLVHHARAVADTASTAAVLVDRVASKARALTPSRSSLTLDSEAAAASWADTSGRVHRIYRDHRRACSDGHYRDTAGLTPSIFAPLQRERGHHQRRPSWSPLTEQRKPSWTTAPARSLGVRDSDRHSPPAPAATTETTALMPKRRHLSYVESEGGCGGEGTLRQGEGGLASSGPRGNSRWLGAGAQCCLEVAHMDSDRSGEFFHDNRLPHVDAPSRAEHPPYSPDHHRLWRQSSPSLQLGTTTPTSSPGLERLGDGDSVEYGIALRPLMRPVASNCVRPPSPLPGLAKVVATAARDEVTGGFGCFFTVGNSHGHPHSGGHDGVGEGAGGGGGVIEWGHRKQEEQRRLFGGMFDTRHRLCKNEQCTRQPSFGMETTPQAGDGGCRFPPLSTPFLLETAPGCSSHPSFGYAAERKARRCARHRLESMESVKGRRRRLREAGAWLREGYLDDEHGHGRKLATKGLLGLDLRERVTWRNAAAPAETSSQYRTGRLLPAGVGTAGAVELEQWHCSPNNVQELDQSGWSSPAGGAFRRRLAQAGEAQAPPPLQQPPPWQMVDLARYARAVAGNADTVDTASSSPVVLFDRVASKTRAMTPSWSSSALDREAAAAECTDSSDRGWAGSSGRAHYGHRDHRRAFSDGHYRDTAGLPPSIWAPLQGQGGQHGSWPSRSPLTGPRWPSRTAAPARSLGVRESDRHLPPAPAVRTETTALLLKRRHLPFAESQGWCGGGGRLRQGEGDLTSSRPEGESRWLGAGNQAFCGGAHTDSDHDRELCHDNTPPRDDAPPRAQHPPYSPDHHRLWRQSSTSPLAGATTVTTATTIPEPERLGDGDFVECRIAVRPLMCPVTSNCVGPPSPLPGLAKVVATAARDQAAEGFRCFSTVGNFHGHLVGGGHDGAGEGAGGGGGGVIEWGHRKQEEERRPCDQVPTETTSTGGTCMEEGCGRRARFSFKGTRKAVYCVKHK